MSGFVWPITWTIFDFCEDISLLYLLFPHSEKIAYGTIIVFLILVIKKTGREFIVFPVIVHAFTAFEFPRAWLICAIAVQFVFF